jgi:hypothetical protein
MGDGGSMNQLQEMMRRAPERGGLPDWAEKLAMRAITSSDQQVIRRLVNIFA